MWACSCVLLCVLYHVKQCSDMNGDEKIGSPLHICVACAFKRILLLVYGIITNLCGMYMIVYEVNILELSNYVCIMTKTG